MGLFDEKRRVHFIATGTAQWRKSKGHYTSQTTITEVEGYASLCSIAVQDSGSFNFNGYSIDKNIVNLNVKVIRQKFESDTETTTTSETSYTITPTKNIDSGDFEWCNEKQSGEINGKTTGDGYKKFSDVLFDLENKWNNIVPKYMYWGDYITDCFANKVLDCSYTKKEDRELFGLSYGLKIIYDNDEENGEEMCPIYADYAADKCFVIDKDGVGLPMGSMDLKCVSTTVTKSFLDMAFSPLNQLSITFPKSFRHYALMHLIYDTDAYKNRTVDNTEVTAKPEVHYHVYYDGNTNPNIYFNWDIKKCLDYEGKEYLPNFFELHKVNVGISYEKNRNVANLGTYNILEGESKKNFTFGELLKIANVNVYDEWLYNLKSGIGLGSLYIYFNSTYFENECFYAEIKQSFNSIESIDYTPVSYPNSIPSLDIQLYNLNDNDNSENGDNDDSGGGGTGGGSGSGVNPHSLLTSTYVMTPNRLKQLGSVLWGSSFMDNIRLVNNSPIENIISIKMFPFTLPTSSDSEVVLGNVSMGVNGSLLPNNYSYEHEIGSVSIPKHYNNFMDFAPFTRLMLYLPYVSVIELDNSLFMGRTLTVKYIIDIVLGTANVMLYADGIIVQEVSCQVGVDIPITSSNRASVEMGIVSNALTSAATGAAVGGVVGAVSGALGGTLMSAGHAKYTSTTSGTPSSACSMYAYKNPILIIDRPIYQEVNGFAHTKGKLCLMNKTINQLKGFTIMDKNIDLKNLPCTNEEKEEIRNLLSSGFFV